MAAAWRHRGVWQQHGVGSSKKRSEMSAAARNNHRGNAAQLPSLAGDIGGGGISISRRQNVV